MGLTPAKMDDTEPTSARKARATVCAFVGLLAGLFIAIALANASAWLNWVGPALLCSMATGIGAILGLRRFHRFLPGSANAFILVTAVGLILVPPFSLFLSSNEVMSLVLYQESVASISLAVVGPLLPRYIWLAQRGPPHRQHFRAVCRHFVRSWCIRLGLAWGDGVP